MNGPALGLSVPGARERRVPCDDGSELRYTVVGNKGPTLVLVNALGQDLLVFSRIAAQLSRQYRIIAWKCRGTFEPSAPRARLWDHVNDLERIVACEAARDCVLLSWCSGAKIALEFAARSPAVRGLVLSNGTYKAIAGLEAMETSFERTLLEICATVVRNPALAPVMQSAMRSLLTGGTGGVGGVGSARTEDAALNALIVEPFQTDATTLRYAGQVVDYLSHDIGPTLARVAAPALVLSGAQDRVSSPAMSLAVSKRLPRASFCELPGGTHYCLYESADVLTSNIRQFLGSIPTTELCEASP